MATGMGLHENVGMRGDLYIRVRSVKTGEVIQTIEIRNKITLLAANVLVELVAQREGVDPGPSANQIYTMRMGTSNTPATRADTNLGAPVFSKVIVDSNKVSGAQGELQFLVTLESGEANGSTLQEAGLFTRGTMTPSPVFGEPDPATPKLRMFARQIHPAIPKTSAITLEYSWRLAFTA
jgi:hypothetical protein